MWIFYLDMFVHFVGVRKISYLALLASHELGGNHFFKKRKKKNNSDHNETRSIPVVYIRHPRVSLSHLPFLFFSHNFQSQKIILIEAWTMISFFNYIPYFAWSFIIKLNFRIEPSLCISTLHNESMITFIIN